MNNFNQLLATANAWQPQHFGKVAVLSGGTSAEREVSLNSGKRVFAACQQLQMDVIALDLGDNPIEQLRDAKVDWVFNIVHGGYGENGLLAHAIELVGIKSASSSAKSMTLTMDKYLTKMLWQQAGLPTPESVLINSATLASGSLQDKLNASLKLIERQGLSLPLVVKPADEGSSLGLYLNHSKDELNHALTQSLASFDSILVEKLIAGTEVTIGIIDKTTLPVIEIKTSSGKYDYEAKYLSNNTQMLIPTSLGEEIEQRIAQLSLAAFSCLGCSIWGRVDAMVDHQGNIYLLEINTLPGMTDHSLVPHAATSVGIDFTRLVQCIFSSALAA